MSLFKQFKNNPNLSKVWFFTNKEGLELEIFAIHGIKKQDKKILTFFNKRIGLIDNTEEALELLERHIQVFNWFSSISNRKKDFKEFIEYLEIV